MNKKILFLILIFLYIIYPKNIEAQNYKFYEAEYVPNIFMNKYEYSTNTIYYQQARFFRMQGSNNEVYCLEPFNFFNESSTYQETNNPRNLSESQIKRIKKIAYFGYRYQNHIDSSWYAVTQLMIWREAFPNSGDYYFTDTLNGNRVNYYDNKIQEINNLVNNYNNQLSINNKNYNVVENHSHIINVEESLNDYSTPNEEITIEDNSIVVKPLIEGTYQIVLNKNMERSSPAIIFESSNSQNMLLRGDIETDPTKFTINVLKTKLTIIKEDEDNNNYLDSSLDGAIFNLYNDNDELIEELEIINNKAEIEDIDFGNYYIKEIKPGTGYQLNDNIYEFTISEENKDITLTVKNKVIEKKIKIIKTYGEENNFLPEEGISFNIYDTNNNLIETITTNNEGVAEIILPYGKYIITQINTTDGYQINEPISITINNTEEEIIKLIDYKIPVPNTYKNNIFKELLLFLKICLKRF